MNALTEYGKILRHYRIDNQILLADMAKALGISPAYLSSIETGNRAVPVDLTEKVVDVYGLGDETRTSLMKAEAETNKSLTIDLREASPEAVDAAVMFAREIKNLSVQEIRDLYNQMHGRRNM